MTRQPASISRREVIRQGGLVLSLGAIVAACGSDRGGSADPGRLGVADVDPELPDGEVNDVVLLRTAQSLEYTALGVYAAAADLDVLSAAENALVGRLVSDHTGHAALLGTLITEQGGEPYECPNPFIAERAVDPILGALDGSDDLHRDVLNIAHAFEALAGASYQALVGSITDPALRREAMRIGADENRHAAALALAINPDVVVSPALAGEPVDPDDDGFPIPYAIPSTFGSLSGIDLVVGAQEAEGGRFAATLQTPAQNTFVYEFESC